MLQKPGTLTAHGLIRTAWRRVALRNLTSSDNHSQLNRLYAVRDPWNLESSQEQHRFEATNAILAERVDRVGTILEIGSGEGHQSMHLKSLCDRLYGLEVSPRAVARARARIPEAEFSVGSLPQVPVVPASGRFDVVVACEVLYYMSDVPAALRRMSELGDACLVTFFSASARIVGRHVESVPGLERGWFSRGSGAWLWAFWRPGRG